MWKSYRLFFVSCSDGGFHCTNFLYWPQFVKSWLQLRKKTRYIISLKNLIVLLMNTKLVLRNNVLKHLLTMTVFLLLNWRPDWPSSSSSFLSSSLAPPASHLLAVHGSNLCQNHHHHHHISPETSNASATHHLTSPNKPDLVLGFCGTCLVRFSQGLTPSYRIAGRYGCLILLGTKTLVTVMRPTSFSLSVPPSAPPSPILSPFTALSPPHSDEPLQVQITAFTSFFHLL